MSTKMDQEELQAAIEELSVQITTQGGAVRELKDRVKSKKKAKVGSSCAAGFARSVLRASIALTVHSIFVYTKDFDNLKHCQRDRTSQLEFACAQEDTSEADADVLAGVEKLKALKEELETLEVQLETVTGIPRDKGAFREAVVRQPVPRRSNARKCAKVSCGSRDPKRNGSCH